MQSFTGLIPVYDLSYPSSTNTKEITVETSIHHINFCDYRWKHRLLLVFAPISTHEDYIQQMNYFIDQTDDLNDRDLLIFSFFEGEMGFQGNRLITVEAAESIRARFGVMPGDFTVLLMGKDGSVKFRADRPTSSTAIYSLIDIMPLRQRELEAQQK